MTALTTFHARTTHSWHLRQRMNPMQYIAPSLGGAVTPPEPYVFDEWAQSPAAEAQRREQQQQQQQQRNGVTTCQSPASGLTQATLNPAKFVPPFRSNGDLDLVHKRNYAATAPARPPLQNKLLPYPLRRSSAKSLLHGGVRTTGLNMPLPDLRYTHSEQLTLPTLHEERRDLQFDAADVGLQLQPLNMANGYRFLMWHNRCCDMQARLRREMDATARAVYSSSSNSKTNSNSKSKSKTPTVVFRKAMRFVQPHSSTLRIEPHTKEEWAQIRADAAAARAEALGAAGTAVGSNAGMRHAQPAAHTQRDAFRPFQSIKPLALGMASVPARNGGYRYASMELHQERLNRKGYGMRKTQRFLWNQDLDTERYEPERGYS